MVHAFSHRHPVFNSSLSSVRVVVVHPHALGNQSLILVHGKALLGRVRADVPRFIVVALLDHDLVSSNRSVDEGVRSSAGRT